MLDRARASLAYQEEISHLLSIALDHCGIGQALAALGDPEQATTALDLAVDTMRRANSMRNLSLMHLTRARHRLTQHDPDRADAADLPEAAKSLAEAEALNHATGYARREPDLHLLRARLHVGELLQPLATIHPLWCGPLHCSV